LRELWNKLPKSTLEFSL